MPKTKELAGIIYATHNNKIIFSLYVAKCIKPLRRDREGWNDGGFKCIHGAPMDRSNLDPRRKNSIDQGRSGDVYRPSYLDEVKTGDMSKSFVMNIL